MWHRFDDFAEVISTDDESGFGSVLSWTGMHRVKAVRLEPFPSEWMRFSGAGRSQTA